MKPIYLFGGGPDRAAELEALARAQLAGARWGVYLTADELDLAADAVAALHEPTVESRALELRFRERARTARGEAA